VPPKKYWYIFYRTTTFHPLVTPTTHHQLPCFLLKEHGVGRDKCHGCGLAFFLANIQPTPYIIPTILPSQRVCLEILSG
jgi:hypothetical protein